MSKIRIKNFGPIKEGYQENDGWIDIKKVTVFIGNQGSGKSTVAKLISSFSWMEKALVRGDYKVKELSRKNKFKNQFLKYHRLENYPQEPDKTIIEYIGNAYSITYENSSLQIRENKTGNYPLPQIMYVPAERNFISYVKNPKELKLSSDSLQEFLNEFVNACNNLKGEVKLPINNVGIEYDKLNDTINIKGEDYKLKLIEASSGFQSLIPLYIVSRFLSHAVNQQSENKDPMSIEELERFRKGVAEIWGNTDFTEEQRRIALSVLSSKFNKTAFINIVEEPEQNLFPSSQRQMLNSLIEFNNMNNGNMLIMTVHSPYIINFLSLAIQAGYLNNKITTTSLRHRLNEIVPATSMLSSKEVVIYQLNEKNGTITQLPNYEGIPSDKNYLNQFLAEGNRLFDELLAIEEEL